VSLIVPHSSQKIPGPFPEAPEKHPIKEITIFNIIYIFLSQQKVVIEKSCNSLKSRLHEEIIDITVFSKFWVSIKRGFTPPLFPSAGGVQREDRA